MMFIPATRIGGYYRGLDSKCWEILSVVILKGSKPATNVSHTDTGKIPWSFESFV